MKLNALIQKHLPFRVLLCALYLIEGISQKKQDNKEYHLKVYYQPHDQGVK